MSGRQGGRPRDPRIDQAVKTATIHLLAEHGMAGLTGEEIARRAGVGKAAIYRRWTSLPHLLATVVADLGVDDVDYGDEPGTARDDLVLLLKAACTGPRALAEAAVLPAVGVSDHLSMAYLEGPNARLLYAVRHMEKRGQARGEQWSPGTRALVGAFVSDFLVQIQVTGRGPRPGAIETYVDDVALPALLGGTSS